MPPREESAEDQLGQVAKKLRDSQTEITIPPDSGSERPDSEFSKAESSTSLKRQVRGPSFWERIKPAVAKLVTAGVIALSSAALGTGAGVRYQESRPPPSVVEVRKLRAAVAAEKVAREKFEAVFDERVKNFREAYKENYSDLRAGIYEDFRRLQAQVESLEAYKAEKEAEERRKRR